VIYETTSSTIHCRTHATASIMSHDHNVLDPQYVDSKLEHRQIVGISRRREISDVAMNEWLTRIEPYNLVGGHAAVGAPDPEILWRLLLLEPVKEPRII